MSSSDHGKAEISLSQGSFGTSPPLSVVLVGHVINCVRVFPRTFSLLSCLPMIAVKVLGCRHLRCPCGRPNSVTALPVMESTCFESYLSPSLATPVDLACLIRPFSCPIYVVGFLKSHI